VAVERQDWIDLLLYVGVKKTAVDVPAIGPQTVALAHQGTHIKSAAKAATWSKASPATPAMATPAGVSTGSSDLFAAYVRAYDASEVPEFQDQLLGNLRRTIFAAARKYGASEKAAGTFFKELQQESFHHRDELLENIAASAGLIWTSARQLRLGPGKSVEFCSLLNRILREGDPELLPAGCSMARGINLLCVTRREQSKLRYPPDGISHRGGALPLAHLPFFTAGKTFRVPMFLATSFSADVAYR
jgi:hypothetical protein